VRRRVQLPGAAELFRVTDTPLPTHAPRPTAVPPVQRDTSPRKAAPIPAHVTPLVSAQMRRTTAPPSGSGRERHDQKITVYLSSGELVEIERARLTLRAAYHIAVDRGRIVREAVAIALADFEAHGPESHLAQRLESGRLA